MDRGLPDGDGLELARTLPGTVYLLTGDDGVMAEEGVGVLLKPVRPMDLDALLR